MILHPSILELISTSLLTGFMVLYASWYGARIIRTWDITSGSELQLGSNSGGIDRVVHGAGDEAGQVPGLHPTGTAGVRCASAARVTTGS